MTDIFQKTVTAFLLLWTFSACAEGVTISPDKDLRKLPDWSEPSTVKTNRSLLVPRFSVSFQPYKDELAGLNAKTVWYKKLIAQLNKTIAAADTDVERRMITQKLRQTQAESGGIFARRDLCDKMVSVEKLVTKNGFFTQPTKALSLLNSYLSVRKNDTTAHFLKGFLLFDTKRYAEAVTELKTAEKSGLSNKHSYYHTAMALFYQSKYQDAITYFDKTTKADGGYAEAYYYRGLCEFKLGQFQKAVQDYNTAAYLDRNLAKPY